MASVQWHSRIRRYQSELESCRLEQVPVEFGEYHPLKPITVTDSKTRRAGRKGSSSSSSSSSSSAPDPLSSFLDGTDPLSLFAAAVTDPLSSGSNAAAGEPGRKRRDKEEEVSVGSDFEPWASKRSEILARFTTTEKLSINLYMGSDKGKAPSPGSAVSEKVRTRLEELDDLEEGSQKELLNLSQQDYVNRIEELNQSLKEAWASDQKVKALKIVIQCSKLLSDTAVIQFYPSKFVLITDILDTFGRLVYERIWSMCADSRPLPDSFSSDDVNDTAKETCLNWFFKIASIRELVPRLYVEAAILKCNRFLSKLGIQETLPRLTAMIRGIGDPLVAVYARAYLCRVGMEVAPQLKDSLNKNFFDLLTTFKQIHGDSVQNQLVLQRVEIPVYLTLYSPAIDWILQCVAYRAPERYWEAVWASGYSCGNGLFKYLFNMNALILNVSGIRAVQNPLISVFVFHSMLLNSCFYIFIQNITMTALFYILLIYFFQDYINCAEIWVEFTCRHFTKREVNTVLADIIKHMTPDRTFEEAYPQLQSVIQKILMYFHDFSVLFSVDRFLPFLDMFQKDSVRVEVCRAIMEVFIRYQQEPTRDPVILNALLHVCKTMHDSVNALTLEDEKRSLALLINGFIRMVSFGRDFEQQLSFCVEARATFCNLEPVLVQLIHTVNQLAMETRRVMRGTHSRKTAAFVRACAAYSFITIPSLTGIFNRLNLYLHSGQVALANQCLSQADAFLKATISLLPEVPRFVSVEGKLRPSEGFLLEFLQSFLSTLLVVPDHPEQGVLYLVRGLLNVVQDYTWEDNSDAKVRVYTSALPLLAAMSQESYLYHIPRVDSNETLYGGDPKFVTEINKLCETLIGQILDHLKTVGKEETLRRQSSLALSLFNCLLAHGDLRNNRLNQLAVNLWTLGQKHGYADTRSTVRTLEFIKQQSQQPDMNHLAELALRLPLQSRT
ncbi:VPS35 endosomal protein sorting factor-like [Huso huso]|uniref:VPS35 endosomal protein-sorting factor-like n=1 Tax=Huso huso TaxID=61971 RepID=A0ABR0YUX8_HUSHU